MDDYERDTPMAARHYEPPGYQVMMEILKLLASNGTVTVTFTLSAGPNSNQATDAVA